MDLPMQPVSEQPSLYLPLLPATLAELAIELASRLQSETFVPREPNRTRREDGAVWLDRTKGQNPDSLIIRLNAYEHGLNVLLHLNLGAEQVVPHSLMIRHSSQGGDDRGLISIPQTPTAQQLPLIENIIYASCTCIQRGQVGRLAQKGMPPSMTGFSLFLPSQPKLATFTDDFTINGLPSLY